jgi:hypothetical protein
METCVLYVEVQGGKSLVGRRIDELLVAIAFYPHGLTVF